MKDSTAKKGAPARGGRSVTGERLAAGVLVGLIALSLLVAAPGLFARAASESASTQLELVMDLDQIELLAESQGYRTSDVVAELAWAGLGAVTWSEATLDKLSRSGDLAVYEGREILDLLAPGGPAGGAPTGAGSSGVLSELSGLAAEGFFQAGYTYAFTSDPNVGSWLEKTAPAHLPPGRYRVERRGTYTVLEISLLKERAVLLNLGFFRPEIERAGVAAAGLSVVLRPANVAGPDAASRLAAQKEESDRLIADGREIGLKYSAIVFAGGEVLGYPDNLDATAALVRELGVPVGAIETPEQLGNIAQLGLGELARKLDYQVVRVYSVPDVKVYAPADLADKTVRSAKERGLRIAYLEPYLVVPENLLAAKAVASDGTSLYAKPPSRGNSLDYTPILALNVNYVRQQVELAKSEGFRIGPAAPLKGPAPIPPWRTAFMSLGPAAGLGLAWLALRFKTPGWRLLGLGGAAVVALGLVGLALTGRGVLASQVSAALAALVFPSLALARLAGAWTGGRTVSSSRAALGLALVDLVVAAGIGLAGGLLVAAILGDLRFMLEFAFFRGVKLTYLVPPAAGLIYWLRYRYPDQTEPKAWPALVTRLVGQPIRIWHALAAAVVGVAGLLYIGRSGNTSALPVSALEATFRRSLERLLYARPRSKEFLLGYPALVAGGWLAHRGRRTYLGWFVLGASVGLVSLVNSFEHIRSPLLLSLVRAANGLWLGAAVGLVAVLVLSLAVGQAGRLERWWRQAQPREEGRS